MRTIVINNQKGGVGKTTIALHLAWHYVEQGQRVLFIDLDAQANATATLAPAATVHGPWRAHRLGWAADLFDAKPLPDAQEAPFQLLAASARLNSVDAAYEAAVEALRAHHSDLVERFEICVIDTPPTFGARNLGALLVCDHLLAPIQLEDFAMSGVNALLKSITVAEKLRGRPLGFLGLLPSQFRANSNLHRLNLEMLISALGKADLVVPAFLTLRQAYADAVARGVPVWTLRDSGATGLAAREMRHVMGLVVDRIGVVA